MVYEYTPPTASEISAGGLALLERVNAQVDDLPFAEAKWAEAHGIVHAYIRDSTVPASILSETLLEVGSKLWARRGMQGEAGFGDTLQASPLLAAKDPMVTVYPILNRFIPGRFA